MNRVFAGSAIACISLLAFASFAQDNPPTAVSANMDLNGLPEGRGIYYHAAGAWVPLSSSVLMPFAEGNNWALEILNVGRHHTVVEIPGAHASTQIGSNARPTFYLHGINPSDVHLVRAESKAEFREIHMPISNHFREWAHFDDKDMADFGIVGVNGDVVAIQPTEDLRPGEYTLAAVVQPGNYWVRLGFDFGVLGR